MSENYAPKSAVGRWFNDRLPLLNLIYGQLFHNPSGILLLDKPESRFNPMDGINLVSQFINLLLQKSHLNNYIFF